MSTWRYAISRLVVLTSAAIVATVALSGCAPTTPAIDSATASRMQESVSAVTEAAAADDPVGAIAALNELEAQLKEDTATGAITADRSARIQASIDLVRADLIAAIPEPAPVETAPAEVPPTDENDKAPGDKSDKNDDKNDKDDKKNKDD